MNATPANGTWSGNGVNSNGLFNPSTLVNGIYNTIYTINNGACSASDTIIITVNQRPDALFQPASLSYCESVGNVALNPVQYGGVWSGNGISNPNDPIFNPSVAGIGVHVITYTIDNNGCIDTYTQSITVSAAPSVQINSGNTEVCLNSSSFTLSGIPFGGVWSGNGITNSASGSFSPQMANPGTHQVVYTVYGGGCYNSDTVSIHVGAIPQSNFDIVGLCENENASFTDLSSISNGSIQSWQ